MKYRRGLASTDSGTSFAMAVAMQPSQGLKMFNCSTIYFPVRACRRG